jgi:hypothetical protein
MKLDLDRVFSKHYAKTRIVLHKKKIYFKLTFRENG